MYNEQKSLLLFADDLANFLFDEIWNHPDYSDVINNKKLYQKAFRLAIIRCEELLESNIIKFEDDI